MTYQKMSCAAIHDLSGVGKCSLTVALPILSACGVETAVMPTAVLSTHTGGFTGYTYRDLTEDMLPMAEHWKKEGCSFDALYSGFLGSPQQIGIVAEIFAMFREKGAFVAVDPVMGDAGKLYATYTKEMADGMGTLCRSADLVMPNFTEACHILGMPYREGPYEEAYVREILERLCAMGPKMAVLTGGVAGRGQPGRRLFRGRYRGGHLVHGPPGARGLPRHRGRVRLHPGGGTPKRHGFAPGLPAGGGLHPAGHRHHPPGGGRPAHGPPSLSATCPGSARGWRTSGRAGNRRFPPAPALSAPASGVGALAPTGARAGAAQPRRRGRGTSARGQPPRAHSPKAPKNSVKTTNFAPAALAKTGEIR